MSDIRKDLQPWDPTGPSDEKLVERLVRIGGRRRAVPAERADRVRQAVFAEWQQALAEDRRSRMTRRWTWTLAAAATIVLGLVLTAWRVGVGPWVPLVPVAFVERVVASVQLESRPDRGFGPSIGRAETGRPVHPGEGIDTGPSGRVALRLASGSSLRLDADTRVRVESREELWLEHGGVYIDNDRAADRGGSVTVRTAFGSARDVGTQFAVRVDEDGLRVRVREGVVQLEHSSGTEEIMAGSEVGLSVSGEIDHGSIPLHGNEWDWVSSITPGFDLDGHTLGEFLSWVSRETGLRLLYLDASTHRRAEEIELSGSATDLTPTEALAAVLPTCGLDHRIEDGTIILEPRGDRSEARP